MRSILLVCLLVAACNERLDKVDLRPPPTPEGMTPIFLDSTLMIRVDGQEVGMLDEPGVLRQSRHRKLMKTLLAKEGKVVEELDDNGSGFKGNGKPVHVAVAPELPYSDLFPLLVSAAWCGYGTFHLSLYGSKDLLGPISLSATAPAMLASETVNGVARSLDLRADPRAVGGQVQLLATIEGPGDARARARRVPHHYRLLGTRPLVDCGNLGRLDTTLCLEGQKPEDQRFLPAIGTWPPGMDADDRGFSVGGPDGCLATASEGTDPVPPWKDQVKASLVALGVGADTLLSLSPSAEVTSARLVDLLAAFPAAGLPYPHLSPQKPPDPEFAGKKRKIEPVACDARIRDAATLQAAEARWIGELRRP